MAPEMLSVMSMDRGVGMDAHAIFRSWLARAGDRTNMSRRRLSRHSGLQR